MSTVLWNDMAKDVTLYLHDVPIFTVGSMMLQIAREYFPASRAWRSSSPISVGTIVANQSNYAISNTAGQEIVGIPKAWVGTEEIGELRPGEANDFYPGQTETDSTKLKIGLVDGSTFVLAPTPTTAGGVVKATVAYGPTAASTGLPDTVYSANWRALRDTCIAQLKMMKDKPWYDPAGASYFRTSGEALELTFSSLQGRSRNTPLRTKKQVI